MTPICFYTKSETQTNIKLSWKLIILTLNIKCHYNFWTAYIKKMWMGWHNLLQPLCKHTETTDYKNCGNQMENITSLISFRTANISIFSPLTFTSAPVLWLTVFYGHISMSKSISIPWKQWYHILQDATWTFVNNELKWVDFQDKCPFNYTYCNETVRKFGRLILPRWLTKLGNSS